MKLAYKSALSGEIPNDTVRRRLRDNLRKMETTLRDDVGRLTPEEYIESHRYLRQVKNAIAAMENAGAIQLLNDGLKVKSRNVADLVRFLRERDLSFAPATPRDEAAYVALYHALAAFDAGMPRPQAAPASLLRDYGAAAADWADPDEAERLLAALLADPAKAKQSSLWRHAARIAERRSQYDTALQRLRRALELDQNRTRDLSDLRRDFAWFLNLAQQCVNEQVNQHRSVPRTLLDGVMAIADQWRAVDLMDGEPCERAGRILRRAGERELAWSYVTSPADLQHGGAAAWLDLALRQHEQEDYDLAERAFAVAAALEPSNAEIVWERAVNHRAAGRRAAARTLFQQLAKGVWAERYRAFQLRAQRTLEEVRD
jgi:Tfp pilus assembly protein PilF